ncbi:MAG: hypothetical protein JOY64_09850 [Alphaproteobacteria bacterium]|nr:hypothetical protein [Alphaproteobacteria bacterium]MBV8407923.1 hypothetical protein [Alphaproteobacteria bacterium]
MNCLLNATIAGVATTPQTGWAAGDMIEYDFIGPRVEIEAVYRQNQSYAGPFGTAVQSRVGQLAIMANLLYDFMPASLSTPYVGAGAGIECVDGNQSLGSTVFAY